MSDAPSEEFEHAVCLEALTVIDCQLCGRVHFACGPNHGDYEPGELDRLLAKQSKEPEKYVGDAQSDSIGWGLIDGKQAVFACPCRKLRRYEDWIWDHREIIVTYLRARTLRDLKIARHEAEQAEQLNVLDPLVSQQP